MNNWLVIADMHIDDYPQFNYEPRARLKQFPALATRLVEIAKENNCDTLVICGDLVNKPTNRPYVWHVVDEVINTFKSNFTKIYYILGQHCVDAKTDIIKRDDTILTIYDDEKFVYMDHKVITLPNGKRIGFKNWTPKQDLSWIDEQVDILFAHYTKSEMFGQPIDESKFKVMIHGDIHNSQEIGQYISIGTPIQKDMSSQQRGTCIVFNPDECSWKRLGVDDNHTRFLRIDYTRSAEEDGFEGPLQYHIYKPSNAVGGGVAKTSVPDWSEVEELIADLVGERGLAHIHGEVKSQNPEIKETDFNFKLTKLKIHGYRSIEDLTLDFTGNDRMILVGNNGSGKSSVIRALKAVFENSRYIRNEQSDFTTSLRVDLDFMYQNKMYHLWKGSDDWGLEIDGTPQGYNNKTEFEADIVRLLPFLNYVDLFFISSNVSNLSNQFTSDRRIELLSKFYRLNRIDSYCKAAAVLRDAKTTKFNLYRDSLNQKNGALDIVNRRLEELRAYEGTVREDYSKVVDELNQLRSDFDIHKDWQNQLGLLEQNYRSHENAVNEYRKRMTINLDECNAEIEHSKEVQSKVSAKIEEVSKRANRFKELCTILEASYRRGIELKSTYDSLNSGVCPTCGSKVCNEHTKAKLDEITKKLNDERELYQSTNIELSYYSDEEKKPGFYTEALKRLQEELQDANDNIVMYSNKVTQYNIAKGDYDNEVRKMDETRESITRHKASEPKNVVLPSDFQTRLFSATSELSKFDNYINENENKAQIEIDIMAIKANMTKIQESIDEYNNYIELTNRSGEVMTLILERMSESFSDSTIKYEAEHGVYRGKPYLKFNAFYKVKNKWRIYESLSDGQKTVSDLDFLSKLFSVQTGVLVLDESLKHLDFNNSPLAWDLLTKMNINTIIISTHDANYANFTRKVMLELDSEGKTQAIII